MSALIHTLIIALAIIAAFVWLSIPGLERFSAQAFFLAVVLYFGFKRLTKAALWHIVPQHASAEMALVTFAVLILVGSTGNLQSWLFPITYLHLFFLVLACELSTTLGITALLLLFHYALSPSLTPGELPHLLALPLIMVCFLFAKLQYDQVRQQEKALNQKDKLAQELGSEDQRWHVFAREFLQPKINLLQQLAKQPVENLSALQGQLMLINLEVEKLLRRLDAKSDSE